MVVRTAATWRGLRTDRGSGSGGWWLRVSVPVRPAGVVFVLLEDEFGVINLIVPPAVYERHRLAVRTEPLMLVEGRLERYAKGGGAINVLVNRIDQISSPRHSGRAGTGLLAARRASPGRAAGCRRGWRCGRFPRGGASGDELRGGPQALTPADAATSRPRAR